MQTWTREDMIDRIRDAEHERKVLDTALDLLDRVWSAWYEDDGAEISDLLDGDVHDFLRQNHPDYVPEHET